MKYFPCLICAILLSLLVSALTAQVLMDKPIQMTGAEDSDRSITNLALPVNPGDATNKAYVDTACRGFKHYEGEFYGGGIVAGVWREGTLEACLIVSLYDISSGQAWSDQPDLEIGAGAQSLIDGESNTQAIIGNSALTESAAKACHDYTGGGYTDWHLPSIYELEMIYKATVVNVVLARNGYAPLAIGRYWSSTEAGPDQAWLLNTENGGSLEVASKMTAGGNMTVRASKIDLNP